MFTLNRIERLFKKDKLEAKNYLYSDGKNLFWSNLQDLILEFKDINLPKQFYRYDSLESRYNVSDSIGQITHLDKFKTIEVLNAPLKDIQHLMEYASNDEYDKRLNCIHFSNRDAVATNRYILKYITMGINLEGSYSIPLNNLKVLMKILVAYKNYKKMDITFQFSDTKVMVTNEHFTWISDLVDREFPNWQYVIPKRFNNLCFVTDWIDYKTVKKFLPKSKLCTLIGSENILYLKVDIGERFKIGKCSHDFEIGFNCNYLDIASNGKKEFEIKFNNNSSPCLINEAIVMPMKL